MSKFLIKYEGQEIEAGEGAFILGRSKECDLKFMGESVSRKHAKLTILQDRIFIEDIGSSNGSFVNGKLVRGETLVQPEDRIHLGKVVVILKRIEESEEFTIIGECPSCHAKISPGLKFCTSCGADLGKVLQPVVSKLGDSTAELPRQQQQQTKTDEPITDEHKEEAFGGSQLPKPQPPAAPMPVVPIQAPVIPSAPVSAEVPPEEQRIRMEAFKSERAGFWIRLLAFLIDEIIISLLMGAICLITIVPYFVIKGGLSIENLNNPEMVSSPWFYIVIGLCVILEIIVALFYVLHGPAKKGGTLGKRILGLKIYTIDGQSPIGWSKAILRVLGYMVNNLTMSIGFLLIAFREDKRGLHDLIAGTMVIKEKK
jgi:uncharacterized RDD family membrane protein YckC